MKRSFLIFLVLTCSLLWVQWVEASEDYSLSFFLGRVLNKGEELSKKEKGELLNQVQGLFERMGRVFEKLVQVTQDRETGFRYDEGKFWMSKLERDRESIEIGARQVKLLGEKPNHLIASITVYKAMRDLADSLSAYNQVPPFCPYVGDLASEVELWADPAFYRGYLLPLAKLKDVELKPPQKEKDKTKSSPPARKPQSPSPRSKNP